MKYEEALEYIEKINPLGINPGLESIGNLLSRLSNPQDELKFIHVAGTNGKGSTSAFICSILKEAGYKVGRYTSPAVFDYREKFSVSGASITGKAFGEYMDIVVTACREMVDAGMPHPTAFEVETALAFLYFNQKKCDYVVLECGMGGLLDATNIVENKELCVFASIGMDHMQYLGNTLEKIAQNKAGIIRNGATVVCMKSQDSVLEILEAEAVKNGCDFVISDSSLTKKVKKNFEKQTFEYKQLKNISIGLLGDFQIQNACLAIDAVNALAQRGANISDKAIINGLNKTIWPGRFEIIKKNPYFVIDGAHNEDAAAKIIKTIENYFTNRRIVYIMGMLKDKDYERVIELTHSAADMIITVTPPNNPRALPAYELAQAVSKVHKNVTAVDSVEEAVEVAKLITDKNDVVIAFGSLSYLSALKTAVLNSKAKKKITV